MHRVSRWRMVITIVGLATVLEVGLATARRALAQTAASPAKLTLVSFVLDSAGTYQATLEYAYPTARGALSVVAAYRKWDQSDGSSYSSVPVSNAASLVAPNGTARLSVALKCNQEPLVRGHTLEVEYVLWERSSILTIPITGIVQPIGFDDYCLHPHVKRPIHTMGISPQDVRQFPRSPRPALPK